MLRSSSKRSATLCQRARGPDEDGDGEAAERRRSEEGALEPEAVADGPDDQRTRTDARVECPHDAAEGSGAAIRIGVLEDERRQRRIGRTESEAEQNGGEDHL